ncbi:MAG: hypothetical protein OHK0046_01380 [Anaerolineae bacterium]
MAFGFIIRDGLESDIPACLSLDHTYTTEYVWQMTLHPDTGQVNVLLKTERLPREMEGMHQPSEERLRLALPEQQCFLVAAGKDEPEILGYLTMRKDEVHHIALVQDVVVSRPYRGRRIATRLLRVARQWALEQELKILTIEIQTKNFPAIQFCQQAGLSFSGFNDHYFSNQDIALFFSQTLRK